MTATAPPQKVVTLAVDADDADDADASGFEPVWHDQNLVGFVTSGGYGHTLDQSLAMAMVFDHFETKPQFLSNEECEEILLELWKAYKEGRLD